MSTSSSESVSYYWVGAFPCAPQAVIALAGIEFPKESRTARQKSSTSWAEYDTHLGAVVALTDAQVQAFAAALRGWVVRPLQPEAEGQSGDAPVVGALFRTATGKDAAELQATGQHTRLKRMIRKRGDRDLAEFLWLIPLAAGEQVQPRPLGSPMPPSIKAAGLMTTGGRVVLSPRKHPALEDEHQASDDFIQEHNVRYIRGLRFTNPVACELRDLAASPWLRGIVGTALESYDVWAEAVRESGLLDGNRTTFVYQKVQRGLTELAHLFQDEVRQ